MAFSGSNTNFYKKFLELTQKRGFRYLNFEKCPETAGSRHDIQCENVVCHGGFLCSMIFLFLNALDCSYSQSWLFSGTYHNVLTKEGNAILEDMLHCNDTSQKCLDILFALYLLQRLCRTFLKLIFCCCSLKLPNDSEAAPYFLPLRCISSSISAFQSSGSGAAQQRTWWIASSITL